MSSSRYGLSEQAASGNEVAAMAVKLWTYLKVLCIATSCVCYRTWHSNFSNSNSTCSSPFDLGCAFCGMIKRHLHGQGIKHVMPSLIRSLQHDTTELASVRQYQEQLMTKSVLRVPSIMHDLVLCTIEDYSKRYRGSAAADVCRLDNCLLCLLGCYRRHCISHDMSCCLHILYRAIKACSPVNVATVMWLSHLQRPKGITAACE
jgi:hypothetical protein